MSETNLRANRGVAFVGALALGVVLGAMSSLACGEAAATTTFTPQTGVVVRSESLTSGIGCGTGSTQIFKYVAVAVDKNHMASAAGVYECFADGVLVNLQPAQQPDGTYSLDYTVQVYAFNQAAYTASQGKITADVAQPNTAGSQFASDAFATLGATYTTSCTATEQGNIQVVAVCAKLAASQISTK